jgi:hypothetical protein
MKAQLKSNLSAGDKTTGLVEVLWSRDHLALVEASQGPPRLIDVDELVVEDESGTPVAGPFSEEERRRRFAAIDLIMKAAAARHAVGGDPFSLRNLEYMAQRETLIYLLPNRSIPHDHIVHVTASEWGTLQAIRDAVVYALTQTGDDVCWMDLYTKLGELTGIPFDPKPLGRARMLGNCTEFVDCLLAARPYVPDAAALKAYRDIVAGIEGRWSDGPDEIAYEIRQFFDEHVPRLLGLEPKP